MSWQCAACLQTNPSGTRFCGHCGARTSGGGDAGQLAASMAELASLLPAGEAWERPDERRLITALFADVSGFTTLADRLDPEQLIERMDPILERMGQIVESYGGHVSKYAGDAILAFFGAPVAHEDDAARAVLAARDMHREIAEVVATLPDDVQHLTLHIGVNTGHVVTGFRGGQVRLDYSVLGDAVNVAQRLEAASSSGEIYVGETTYALARKAVQFESVGELVVKGKPEPIRAWRVAGELPSSVLPAGNDAVTFGRESETSRIDDVLATVAGGGSGLVALVGEPGVGKSRLLQEMQKRAVDSSIEWLDTRCLSYGAALAYRPYLELVRRMSGVSPNDTPEQVRSDVTEFAASVGLIDQAAYLVHLAGVPSPDIPPAIRENAQALRRGVQDAIVAALVARARSSPIAVAIEDLHWMDAASLEVTELLVSRSAAAPICLAFTARPEGMPAIERLAGAGASAHVLELTGLDLDAAHQVAQAIVGAPLEPATLADLVARTGGNALFVQEVVRSLLDARTLVPGPTGWTVAAGDSGTDVPSTIESVLAARIDLLPREAGDVLQVASVIGREVRLLMLQDLVTLPPSSLEQVVDVLLERQFLDRVVEADEPRLVFHHALVADVAYGRLLRRRRGELHRRLVEIGLRLYGSGDDVIDLLARHAYLGGMGAEALPYVERAADRATAVFANAEAMGYLEQALEIADADKIPAGERAALLMKRGELLGRTGRFAEAARDYRQAYDIAGEVRAALAQAATLSRMDRLAECSDLLDAVEENHPNLSAIQRGTMVSTRARIMALSGSVPGAVDVLSAGIDQLVDAGPEGSVIEAELRQFRGRLRSMVGAHAEASQDLELATETLERAGDLPRLATALRTLGGVMTDSGRIEEGLAVLRRALDMARQVGHAEEIGAASLNLGWAYSDQRRFDEALACTAEAMAAFASMGLMSGVANAKVNRCDILLELDRLDEAFDEGLEALEVARETGNRPWSAGALAALAEVALRRGDYAACAEYGTESVQMFEALGDEYHASLGRERLAKSREAAEGAS